MLRRLFTFLSIVSLLLCVATCVLWVRSYYYLTVVTWYGRQYNGAPLCTFELCAVAGRLLLYREEWDRGEPQKDEIDVRDTAVDATPKIVGTWFGFSIDAPADVKWDTRSLWGGSLPYWFVTSATALLPIVWVHRFRANRKRLGYDLCPSCGYDLRASADRCPECGAAAAALATNSSERLDHS